MMGLFSEGTYNRSGLRIECGAAPVGATDVAGHLDGAALGRRREQRAVVELLQHLERLRLAARA